MDLDFPPVGAEWTFFICALVILLGPFLAGRVRLPGMVGIVLGGMLIGPNVLDWVPREGIVEGVGQLGLLTLMFLAGLELDLEEFARRRTESVRFGLITFTIPLVLGGIVGAVGFDYALGAAILYGSLWASHTLVAYPIVRNEGLAGHPAVGVAVSGTVITDTLALFILAVVVGADAGDGSPVEIVGGLMLGMVILVAFAFLLVPVLMRRFFSGAGRDRALRFVGVVAAFTGVAVVADLGGLEGIVGAFFAGLAINRLIPNRSPLMDRLEFFGSSLLVPFFLISTGMIIDPSKLTEAKTLQLGVASLAVVVVGKLAAAILAGRLGHWSRPAVGLVFSLTVAQAAATLAAVIVGLEAGIFDETLVNAALVVVLVSLIIAPLGAAHFSKQVPAPALLGGRRLGETVLVPVADDNLGPRGTLSALVARADKGVVVPVALVPETGDAAAHATARERLERIESIVGRLGVETVGRTRVTDSIPNGVLRAAVEDDASCVMVSWEGLAAARSDLFGGASEGLLAESAVPTLVVAGGAGEPTGVVLALSRADVRAHGHSETLFAVRAARLIAGGMGVEPRVLAPDPEFARPLLVDIERAPVHGYAGTRAEALGASVGPGDVVVMARRMSREVLEGDAAELIRRHDAPTVVLAVPPVAQGRHVPSTGILAARS